MLESVDYPSIPLSWLFNCFITLWMYFTEEKNTTCFSYTRSNAATCRLNPSIKIKLFYWKFWFLRTYTDVAHLPWTAVDSYKWWEWLPNVHKCISVGQVHDFHFLNRISDNLGTLQFNPLARISNLGNMPLIRSEKWTCCNSECSDFFKTKKPKLHQWTKMCWNHLHCHRNLFHKIYVNDNCCWTWIHENASESRPFLKRFKHVVSIHFIKNFIFRRESLFTFC